MPKKILVIAGGTYISGAEVITLGVLKGLKEKGNKIHCIVSGWNNGDFIDKLTEMQISYTPIKLGWFYINKLKWSIDSLIHLPKAIFQFLKLKKNFKADIVYTITFRPIVLLYPFFKKNIFFHIHDPYSDSKQSKFFLKTIEKKIVKYIAVSNFIKQDLVNCGITEKKIELVYNGIDIFSLEKLNANNTNFNIGIIGQVIRRKGHMVAIDALKILVQKKMNIKLVIIGKGDDLFEQELKNKIAESNLHLFVEWKGFLKNKNLIYENLDVVIAPTQNEEPFGLMACEANMFQIPAIVSNKGGLSEIIEDGINGYLINANDANQLAEKLEILYKNESLRIEMGKKGREKVKQNFSLEQMNTKILKLLHYEISSN